MIFALEGPDGVGKTTIWRELAKRFNGVFVARHESGYLGMWDHDKMLPVGLWEPRHYSGKWLFLNEELPDIVKQKHRMDDPVWRSWTYTYYRWIYRIPRDIAAAAKGIIMDRSWLSNVVYLTGDPELQQRIELVERCLAESDVDKFIILVGAHQEKGDTFADVDEITRRYLAWAKGRGCCYTLSTGGMSVKEVADAVEAYIKEVSHV